MLLLPLSCRLPWWLSSKEPACQGSRCGFDPWVGKIPWRGNGSPLQYSCLENFMDTGAWWATVHGVAKESDMTQRLNNKNITLLTLGQVSSLPQTPDKPLGPCDED